MKTYRIIEQGNGLGGLSAGVEVYASEAGELLRLVSTPGRICTDDARGNYVVVQAEPSDHDVTSLTDAEFGALPQVRVVEVAA